MQRKDPCRDLLLFVEFLLDIAEVFLLDDLVDDGLQCHIKRTVFTVVSFLGKVYASMGKQVTQIE